MIESAIIKKLGHALVRVAAIAATATIGVPNAKATTAYTQTDNFQTSPTDWTPWNSGAFSVVLVTTDANALSPTRDAYLYFGVGGTTSDFAVLDKEFDVLPFAQGGPHTAAIPTGCYADISLEPTGGATGAFQLLDASSYAYIASKPFTLSPSANWTEETIFLAAGPCSRNMIVRLVLNSTTHSQTLRADELTLTWLF